MRSNFAILALLLAATMAAAQMRPPQGQSPNPYGQVQPQSGPQNQAPSNAPSPSSGNQQAPSSTASGHKLLQAKSQDELKAYQGAMSKTDPAQMNAAADAFAAKYPDSELKATLYIRTMTMYGQANNAEKVIELGRKAIAADPTNPIPLVQVGSTLVEGTRDTDMDRDQRLTEAAKDAQGAIDNISQLMVPPDAPADKVAAVKANILSMAYGALGMVDLNKKDYASAEQQFLKAVDASKAQPEAAVFLRLSVAQDQLKKYPEALDSANKALQYAPQGSAALNLAKQQQERLQKLMAAGSGTAIPSSIAPVTPAPNPPAAQTPAQTSPAQTPPAQTPPAQTPPNPPH
jgi:tetratricopeptide (TPR) repeat protein